MCVKFYRRFLLATLLFLGAMAGRAQVPYLADFPAGATPQEIGCRVVENFLPRSHMVPTYIHYAEVFTWQSGLAFAQLAARPDLTQALIQKFMPLMSPPESGLISTREHVDYAVFGVLPLELFLQTRAPIYRQMGMAPADKQWSRTIKGGLSYQTRWWIDDMYMITMLQLQAYRATGNTRYLDRAANEMVAYLGKLQRRNGLFYHSPDAPFYWGRGNGWVAVGMTELLRAMPKRHSKRDKVLTAYRKMMEALLKYQQPDGMWRQLIDRQGVWVESSCSAMFTYAMITGVKRGWLDANRFGPAARNGWLGLITYLDPNANLTQVCVGTNRKNDLQFYLNRPRITGDLHGQAPLLWCAVALLR